MKRQFSEFYKIMKLVGKRKMIGIQAILLVNSIAELAVVAIIPFYFSIIADSTLQLGSLKHSIFSAAGLVIENKLDVKYIGLLCVLLILFSNILIIITNNSILKFSALSGAAFSDSLFKYYLNKDYLFFTKNNSAEIITDIILESQRLNSGIVFSYLIFVSRCLLVLFIFAGLIITNPKATLAMVAVILVFYFIYYRSIRKKLFRNSQIVSEFSTKRHKILAEAFSLAKELKVYQKEAFFTKHQRDYHLKITNGNAENAVLAFVSKYFFETLVFSMACFMIYSIDSSGYNLKAILPHISLYLLAIYKLLPSVQAVFNSFSTLKANITILDKIGPKVQEGSMVKFKDAGQVLSPLIIPKNIIEFKNVFFSYDGIKNQVSNLNFKIPVGKKIAFVGASGAGKTTVANMLLGLIKPSQGQIVVDDNYEISNSSEEWIRSVSFIPQSINLMDESLEDNISFFEKNFEQIHAASLGANILSFIEGLPNKFQTLAGDNGIKLSGGQKQRIGLARALYFNRPVIILDEATSALDNNSEYEVMKNISEIRDKTIIIIAHRMSTVKYADLICVFDEGKVVGVGTYENLLKTCSKFENLVSKELKISVEHTDAI